MTFAYTRLGLVRSLRPQPGRRGFTLMELLLVVAIFGAMVSLAFSTVRRRKEELSLEQVARDLKGRIQQARALAAVAGPRLATNRLELDASCPSIGVDPELWITIDPVRGIYIVPADLTYDAGRDVLIARCDRIDIPDLTRGLGRIALPASATNLAFSPNGHVVGAPGAADLFVRIEHTTEPNVRYAFRVLPSGIVCTADDPTSVSCHMDALP